MGDDRNVPRATTHASVSETPTVGAPLTTPPRTSASRDPSTGSDPVPRLGFHGERGRAWAGSIVQLNAELAQRHPVLVGDIDRRLVARAREIPRGTFDASALAGNPHGALGLLVLDGFIAVGLDAGRAQVTWLIGAGDLIRPWELLDTPLTEHPNWRALSRVRLAMLDGEFERRAAGIPGTAQAAVARAARTSHWLLAKSLIVSAPLIEERLLLLFTMLAERWGKVRPDGVWLELPLTHELLARMSGARRPSVSTALRSLSNAGAVTRVRRGCWILHGPYSSAASPPLRSTRDCWRLYADAIGFPGTTGDRTSPLRHDRAA